MYRLSFKQLAFLPALLLACGTFLSAQESDFNYHFNFNDFAQDNPCKPFIGVGTSKSAEGLRVDYTVDNTPATTYGVFKGDVILTLDGVPVQSQAELIRERDKHQQGDAFTLRIMRDGVEKTIQARFKSCSTEELEAAKQNLENALAEKEIRLEEMKTIMAEKFKGFEMSERPILGVYENEEVNVAGVVVGTILPGKGAEAAGLQVGDVVINVDGKTITGGTTLRQALENRKPGDLVPLTYLREGKTLQTQLTLSVDRGYFNARVERDPCKVFIGVYTSDHAFNGLGTRVNGVIDGTPAKESAVQQGDVIIAFNGIPVNSYQELTAQRDKNKPGDAFSMTILRDGATLEIKARFKSCDTPEKAPAPVVETPVAVEENAVAEPREMPKDVDNNLNLEVFEAFPSPTYGTLNIKFEAEAVPTSVRILDISGRVVYRKELPKFDGAFSEQLNLSSQKAGNYVLSVQQGDKVQSKQIVLLPRA